MKTKMFILLIWSQLNNFFFFLRSGFLSFWKSTHMFVSMFVCITGKPNEPNSLLIPNAIHKQLNWWKQEQGKLDKAKKKCDHCYRCVNLRTGVLNYIFMKGQKKIKIYVLEGQMDTTFWAFSIYFSVFRRWSKGQTEVISGPDLAHGLPLENPWNCMHHRKIFVNVSAVCVDDTMLSNQNLHKYVILLFWYPRPIAFVFCYLNDQYFNSTVSISRGWCIIPNQHL